MKVLFTIAGLHPESGGPARSVPALCEALGCNGVEVEIASLDYGGRFSEPLTPTRKSVRTTYVDCSSQLACRTQWTPKFKRALFERCQTSGARIIHDTGLWLSTNHAAAAVSAQLKIPRIVSPRGMLTGWSLHHKGWKKRIAWWMYQRRDLHSASMLHATSQDEADGFRALGLKQPIAIIPNGVTLPLGNRKSEIGSRKSEIRTALFLSRIHPKKGLLDLVHAWARVRPTGWRMVVAGNDANGHLEEVQADCRKQKVEKEFEFIGPIEGEAKWALYRSADLFILPSHSENFGIVIAEALACGVPVITTRGTPWEGLLTHHCGWWTEIGNEPLAAALREATNCDETARCAMGVRGRQWMEQDFSWAGVAQNMLNVYEWMLGAGAKPECVLTMPTGSRTKDS